MNELLLAKHLVELCDVCRTGGILQLDEYNNSSNKWIKNYMYAYCLNSSMNGYFSFEEVNITKYLKVNRTREELIIITGFELIFECNKLESKPNSNPFFDVADKSKIIHAARILSVLLEHPVDYIELLPEYLRKIEIEKSEKISKQMSESLDYIFNELNEKHEKKDK